jgi:hypothetical protein
MTATGASPRRAQSLRGHISEETEDFPRHYPPTNLLIGEGFAVMSGCAHEVTFVWGSCVYPTRNFATLGILVTPPSAGCRSVARSFLPDSPCRHEDRTVPSPLKNGVSSTAPSVQSLRIPLPRFPADCPHRSDCHCPYFIGRVPPDTRMFQQTAGFDNGQWKLTVIVTAAVYRGLASELCSRRS